MKSSYNLFPLLILLFLTLSCVKVEQLGEAGGRSGFSGGKNEHITDHMKYLGAFGIGGGTYGVSNSSYTIGALAYNPDKHSIYMAGHSHHNAIAEYAIPELVKSDNIHDLNFETVPLQNYVSVLGRGQTGNPENNDRITGLYYINGKLIVNSENWYDADGANATTTLVFRDADQLETSVVDGFFELEGKAHAAGYISPVPREWQNQVGSTHIVGWSNVHSIIGRYSIGPSMFSFDIDSLLQPYSDQTASIPTRAILNYPFDEKKYLHEDAAKMSVGIGEGASPLWNNLAEGRFGFIIPGTKIFAVIGSLAGIVGGIGYKIVQDTGKLCGGPCPYIASEKYNYYWLYNMDDILSADLYSDPKPYAFGKWKMPHDDEGRHSIIGASFDSEQKILYITLHGAGQKGDYDVNPLILAYKVR